MSLVTSGIFTYLYFFILMNFYFTPFQSIVLHFWLVPVSQQLTDSVLSEWIRSIVHGWLEINQELMAWKVNDNKFNIIVNENHV